MLTRAGRGTGARRERARHFFDLVSNDELEVIGAVFDRVLENLKHETT